MEKCIRTCAIKYMKCLKINSDNRPVCDEKFIINYENCKQFERSVKTIQELTKRIKKN